MRGELEIAVGTVIRTYRMYVILLLGANAKYTKSEPPTVNVKDAESGMYERYRM